jgi:hypothetical protein
MNSMQLQKQQVNNAEEKFVSVKWQNHHPCGKAWRPVPPGKSRIDASGTEGEIGLNVAVSGPRQNWLKKSSQPFKR